MSGMVAWCQVCGSGVRYVGLVSGMVAWCQVCGSGVRYVGLVSGMGPGSSLE